MSMTRPAVEWDDAPRLGKRSERLRDAKSMGSLLERYEQLDLEMMRLERGTTAAVKAWNGLLQTAEDMARDV